MASLHAMKNKMHAKFSQSGNDKDCVTHSQLFVLALIEQHQNIGIKEIAKKLHISSSAATQLVDVLVESGYAVRKADSKDRRALQLELSPKGHKHFVELKNKHVKNMSLVFDVLNDEELEVYVKLQKKILSGILDKKI